MPGQPTDYPCLGNDIVDLTHPDAKDIHPRFAERICTQAELDMLSLFPQLSLPWIQQLWRFWSIKEAAFKAVKRYDPTVKFRWKDFDGALEPGMVRCPHEITLSIYTNTPDKSLSIQSYIHTIAYNSCFLRSSMHVQVDTISLKKTDISNEIRKLFVNNIHEQFNVDKDQVNWNRHISGAPVCSVNGKNLPFIISFSHHGRYMAFVLVASSR